MTRFKELRRIERAIANRDVVDLRWALLYCDSRRQWEGETKKWREIAEKARRVLASIEQTEGG